MTDPKTRKEIEQVVDALDDVPVDEQEAREAMQRLGIDTKAWASAIRSRVDAAAAAEREPRFRAAREAYAWAGDMMLPRDTPLGDLRVDAVLDAYDGPRLAVVRNRAGVAYLALWIEETDAARADAWYYVMVSEERLVDVRQGAIDLRTAFLDAEDGFVAQIEVAKQGGGAKCEWVSTVNIDPNALPPEGDCLSLSETEIPPLAANAAPQATGARIFVERIYVDRAVQGKALGQDVVAATWGLWFDCRVASLRANGFKSASGAPAASAAAIGSFSVDLSFPAGEVYARCIAGWQAYVGSHGADDPRERLIEARIDSSTCEALLWHLVRFNLRFKVTLLSKSNQAINFELDASRARQLLHELEGALPVLGTDKIPQADDLERVVAVLREIEGKGDAVAENLSITKRQVDYYKHAARVLGLLTSADMLTGPGKRVTRVQGIPQRDEVLRNQFEASDCALAWCRWANVQSVANVDPATAEAFLVHIVPSFAASTAERRAKTLASWHEKLFPRAK